MNRRRGILVLALMLAVWLVPAPAMADAPANDDIGGAVAIEALPYHVMQDTTEATVSEADLEAALQCLGPPDYAATVWYSFTSDFDGAININGGETDYSVGFLVYVGTPDALELVDCFPYDGIVSVETGTTYYIQVIDDQVDGGGNGGMLDMHVNDLGAEICPGIFENDPTLMSGNLIIGTPGDDVLEGTNGRDIILGLEGNDTIHGLGGDDAIAGCDGDDHIDGGPGNDEILGDAFGFFGDPEYVGGNDFVDGRGGHDFIFGGAGDDVLRGGFGDDFVVGHQGDDLVKGHRGNDELLGGLGNDRIEGHRNDDFLSGGWGDDFLKAGRGNDVMTGSPPAFPPDSEDPDPEAHDICRGGPGADFGWHCEVLLSSQSPDVGFDFYSTWGVSQYSSPGFGRR